MHIRLKFFTGILLFIAAIAALWRFLPDNIGPQRAYFLGVDGDPRMRVCQSAAEARNATKEAVAALKLDIPYAANPADKANYRISVFQAASGKVVSIEIRTPKIGAAGIVNIATYENGKTNFESKELNFDQAKSIIKAFELAKIWGPLQRTFEPKKITGPASAVIEINAPDQKRCIATRYDDERVAGLLREIANRVSSIATKTDINGFAPPLAQMFGKDVK